MSARKWIVIGAGLAIVAYGLVTQSGKSPQDEAETAAQDTAKNATPHHSRRCRSRHLQTPKCGA